MRIGESICGEERGRNFLSCGINRQGLMVLNSSIGVVPVKSVDSLELTVWD